MRRSSPALFELINGGSVGRRAGAPAPAASAAAPVRVEVQAPDVATDPESAPTTSAVSPEPRPAPEPAPPREPYSYETESPRVLDLQRRFNISLSVILLAAAGVIALCVLAWSAAYEAGKREAEDAARRELRLHSSSGPVRDPLNSDLPLNPNLVNAAPPTAPAPSPNTPAPVPPPGSGDPREVGKNYLQLVTTDKSEAEGITKFLGDNNVPAFMIPVRVERTGNTAKNPTRFTVFAARGITPEEFSGRAPSRTELEGAINRLGRRWKDERRGSTDFSGAIWSKFKG